MLSHQSAMAKLEDLSNSSLKIYYLKQCHAEKTEIESVRGITLDNSMNVMLLSIMHKLQNNGLQKSILSLI